MLYCHDDSCRSAPMPAIFALPMLASLITYLVQGVDLGNVLGPVKVRNEGHHPQRWQKRAIQPFQKLFLLLVSPGLAIRIVFITGRRRVDGDEFDFFSFLVLGDGIHGVCIGISLTRKICVKNRYYQPIPIFHSRLRRRMYLRREWAVYWSILPSPIQFLCSQPKNTNRKKIPQTTKVREPEDARPSKGKHFQSRYLGCIVSTSHWLRSTLL